MAWTEFKNNVVSDLKRYMATGATSKFRVIFFYQGFWASFCYRFCRFLMLMCKDTFLHYPVSFFIILYEKIIQIFTGISLPIGCQIGDGLYIGHFGGIIVSDQTRIGRNCNISYQVGIGFGRKNGKFGHPELGDRVFVGPGAKIFGPVRIGNDAAIGANAVVISDVPSRAVVVGVPADVVSYHGSFDYIFYDNMDTDPERVNSLAQVQK